ncbi:MAG: FtsX-like permease family protein [Massilia sp.]
MLERLPDSLAPRWRKLLRDMQAEKERVALMLAAITVSLAAVGAVLGAYAVLTREIGTSYLGTHPAAATLELEGDADAAALAIARASPGVAVAEAREVLQARVRVGADWRPLLLFVIDDFSAMRLNTVTRLEGAWPPPAGAMLIEQSAAAMFSGARAGTLLVKTANGAPRAIAVHGMVHDPSLAPAWQEREGYGYISRATLAVLGEPRALHELRIGLRDPLAERPAITALAAQLAASLGAAGHPVHEIRIPPPRQHPHQRQMTTMLFLMLSFSLLALLLGAILVASLLSALLARQVREIGVMKTVGARTSQIFAQYTVLVALLGASALLIAMPLGLAIGEKMAGAISGLLNFRIADSAAPWWVFLVQAAAGIALPLLVAALPIGAASRMSVRAALDQVGGATETLRQWAARLPWPLRNALRRPRRLALTVALLASGGAMFMAALNVKASWERNIDKVYQTRHYDVEITFHHAEPAQVAERLRALPGVAEVEAWGYSPTAFARPGQIDIASTYPDRAHASFAMLAPPAATRMISFPVLAGRWLRADDEDAVVLNHAALARAPALRIGQRITLSIDGRARDWRLVGVVEEIGAAGVAYVNQAAFARAAGTGEAARMLRIAARAGSPAQREQLVRAIDQLLLDDGVSVDTAVPLTELRTAMSDHIAILIKALMAMALVMASVGGLGLTAAMSISVLERAREFGIMKTIGATPRRISALLLGEALSIAAAGWCAALLLALPLTLLLDILVGQLGFVAPLPFVVAAAPAAAWLALLALLSVLATWLPARRAGQSSVAVALLGL